MLIQQNQQAETLPIGHKILVDGELNSHPAISGEVYHSGLLLCQHIIVCRDSEIAPTDESVSVAIRRSLLPMSPSRFGDRSYR